MAEPPASPTGADDSDEQLLARAVADLAKATRFPVAFGGLATASGVTITSVVGGHTRSLSGLRVMPTKGLGGRAMVESRPRMTADYGSSTHITHDYDAQVLAEDIAALIAVPVMVGGHTRAILYGGARHVAPQGDVFARPAMAIAEALGHELRIRDEVRRRVASLTGPIEAAPATRLAPAHREELRESYAELRSIAAAVADPALRRRLEAIEERITALSGEAVPTGEQIHLSPRETDVLACAALGYTNAQIANALGLREGTVKAYLGSAMSKLDASTRHSAVTKARRVGILP